MFSELKFVYLYLFVCLLNNFNSCCLCVHTWGMYRTAMENDMMAWNERKRSVLYTHTIEVCTGMNYGCVDISDVKFSNNYLEREKNTWQLDDDKNINRFSQTHIWYIILLLFTINSINMNAKRTQNSSCNKRHRWTTLW